MVFKNTWKKWVAVGAILLIGGGYVYQRLTRPMVSVVISAYNMEDTLSAAIDSIINQTMSDWELIVVDDGSTDGTAALLKTYQAKEPRLKIITNNENKGVVPSLNRGVVKARGKYVARMDADDTSYPDRLERQVQFMEKNHLDLCAAVRDIPQEKFKEGDYLYPDDTRSDQLGIELLFENFFSHPTIMFNRDFVRKNGLKYNKNYPNAEDHNLWIKIFMKGGKIAFMGGKPVTTYQYSGHPEKWWKKSQKSFLLTKKWVLRQVIPDLRERMADLSKCDLLPLMIEGNKTTQVLNDKVLAEMELKSCVPQLEFIHPGWRAHFSHIQGRRFQRVEGEKATLSRNARGILVEWDKWPAEQFECNTVRCVKTGFDLDK